MAVDLRPTVDLRTPAQGRFNRWLKIGVVALSALISTLAVVSLKSSHDAFEQKAQVAAENLAATLQQTIDTEVLKVDTALQNVIVQVRPALSGTRLAERSFAESVLAGQEALTPDLQGLRITDADGIVRVGTAVAADEHLDLSDREFFRLARDAKDGGLVISGPVLTRTDKRWVMVLARRLASSEGAFSGVVYAHMPIDHFQRILASVDVGPMGAVTLRTHSMQLVGRHVPSQTASLPVGTTNVSEVLVQAMQRDPRRGSFVATTALDGVERITAYRQVGNHPLLVLVGFDRATYFGLWRQQALLVGGLTAVVLIVLFGASTLVLRAWQLESVQRSALLREGRRNHGLLLTASDGLHVLTRDGMVVELSDLFASMLGYERNALIGRHVSTWDASIDQGVIQQWLQSFELGERRKFATRHRRSDGSLIDVEIHSAGVRIEDQELVFCSARDITARKQMERQLAASAQEIHDLYDNAPCGYHSLDANGIFVHINATQLSWLGYTRSEVVGKKHAFEFLTEQGRATFERNFPQIKANGSLDGVEIDLVCRDGSRRRVSINSSAVLDGQGNFLRSRTAVFDMTELHRTKEQLSKLSREQEAMLDNDMIGIARIRNREIVWKNPAMDRIFGYAPGEMIGLPTRRLHVDEETFASEGAAAYPLLLQGGHYRRQLEMSRRDGQRIWIDSNGVIISGDTGESLWMFTDITPIKQAQAHVEHIAFHDGLTGLPNRLLLADRLQQGMAHAARNNRLLAACYLDLDGFKKVNDELGHAAGDLLLQEIARRLQASIRANDTVSRLGGDEFVLLMTELESRSECLAALARIQAEVGKSVQLRDGQEALVSASMGVAFYPGNGSDPDTLLRNADAAMYKAKRAGRNQFQLYD